VRILDENYVFLPPEIPSPTSLTQPCSQARVPARIVRHSFDPCAFFDGKKNSDCETNGDLLFPPPIGVTAGMGRERELTERDGSRKRSRNYSRELRERTSVGDKDRLVRAQCVALF